MVYFGLLGVAVGEVGERRHCSEDGVGEPDGVWEDTCGKQLDGGIEGGLGEKAFVIRSHLLNSNGNFWEARHVHAGM